MISKVSFDSSIMHVAPFLIFFFFEKLCSSLINNTILKVSFKSFVLSHDALVVYTLQENTQFPTRNVGIKFWEILRNLSEISHKITIYHLLTSCCNFRWVFDKKTNKSKFIENSWLSLQPLCIRLKNLISNKMIFFS